MNITVLEEFNGKRADVFLAEFVAEIPTRSAAQKLISDSCIFFKNKAVSKNFRVTTGDVLTCQLPAAVPLEAVAQDIPLCVVYEDADLLVINKPRGMVVHPAAGHFDDTLVNALLFHCGDSLSGIGGVLRPGIVHRLDKDTSGLMVVAKNDAAHQSLAAQLADRTMGRVYYAICHGVMKDDTRRIDLPIGRHPHDRKKMAVVTKAGTRARDAVTHVEVLERFRKFMLVSAKLETGRTHQIRVHMAAIGFPVLGDEVYAAKTRSLGGQILHAKKIHFTHPSSEEEMEFEVELPKYFLETLATICI